jgi:hypothetical protein
MAAQVEKIVEGAVGGEKALSLAGRFKPPHLAVHNLSNLDIRACAVPKTLVYAIEFCPKGDNFL